MNAKNSRPNRRILVIASTFPASEHDSVPAFVRDQVIALKAIDPATDYHVLAPHVHDSTKSYTEHPQFFEHRFHYAWPRRCETLTKQGILPALKQNPLFYTLVPALFIGEFWALLKLTRKLKPECLYAHWFTPQAIVAHWVGIITRTPFVFTTHAADVDVWKKLPWIGKKIVTHTTKKATAITAVSPRSMKKLEGFFSPNAWKKITPKTQIIPMGTELALAKTPSKTDLKKTYGYSGKKVFLFMGRLAEKKGVSYLLEAFEGLSDSKTVLIIAGDGPLAGALKTQATKLKNSKNIHFPGYISGQKKAEYIALADVVVLPSIITDDGDAEGLPVVFMEALAASKICIATNESGADQIIQHKKSGFLLPHKNSAQLQKIMHEALSLTSAKKQAMERNARTVAQQFDWPHIAKQHLDFLFTRRS